MISKPIFYFLIFLVSINSILAVPQLPMVLSGDVNINNKPAKVGTSVEVKIDDNIVKTIEVKNKGLYTLTFQGENGDNVGVFVNGVEAYSGVYESGKVEKTELNVDIKGEVNYFVWGVIVLIFLIVISFVIPKIFKKKKSL